MEDDSKLNKFQKFCELLKKYKNRIASTLNFTDKISSIVFFITKFMRGVEYLVVSTGTLLKVLFTSIPWLQAIFTFLDSSVTAINCISDNRESLHARIAKFIIALLRIGLSITSFVVLALGLVTFGLPIMLTLVSTEVVLDAYFIISEVNSRFRGDWKQFLEEIKESEKELIGLYANYVKLYVQLQQQITNKNPNADEVDRLKKTCEEYKILILKKYNAVINLENKNTLREALLTDTVHTLLISLVTIVAGALLLTPAIEAGAILLVISAVYGAIDKLDLNPAKHILRLSRLNPFQKKDFKHTFDEIELTLEAKIMDQPFNSSTTHQIFKSLAMKEFQLPETPQKISLLKQHPNEKISLLADVKHRENLRLKMH